MTAEPFDTDKMAQSFQRQFPASAMTKGQLLVFGFENKPNLRLTVRTMGSKLVYLSTLRILIGSLKNSGILLLCFAVIDLNAVTGADKKKTDSSEVRCLYIRACVQFMVNVDLF